MELYNLIQFKAIAESCTMVEAAELLFISQPALSKNLHKLEQEFNCEFFDRSGKKLVLNEKGLMFLKYANQILNDVDNLYKSFEIQKNKKILNIYFDSDIFLRRILAGFMQDHPDVLIKAKTMDFEQCLEALYLRKADIVVLLQNYSKHAPEKYLKKNLRCIRLYDSRLYLTTPLESVYADLDSISIEELSEVPIIRLNKKRLSEMWLDEITAQRKLVLNVIGEVDLVTMNSLILTPNSSYNCMAASTHIEADERWKKFRKIIRIEDDLSRKSYYLYAYNNANTNKYINSMLDKFYQMPKKI